MRSGKTHSARLEIEGRKEKQTPGPGREEQVQPIWHVELESETYIQTQIAVGLSLTDPLLIFFRLSLYHFHSPCSSTLIFSLSFPVQSKTCFFRCLSFALPSPHIVFPLSFFFVFPSSSSSQPSSWVQQRVISLSISLSCRRTWAFAVRVFAARTQRLLSSASSVSFRGLQ